MPTYEYQCEECGRVFSLVQTFAQHDKQKEVKCPKCNGMKVGRVIGATFVKTSKKS